MKKKSCKTRSETWIISLLTKKSKPGINHRSPQRSSHPSIFEVKVELVVGLLEVQDPLEVWSHHSPQVHLLRFAEIDHTKAMFQEVWLQHLWKSDALCKLTIGKLGHLKWSVPCRYNRPKISLQKYTLPAQVERTHGGTHVTCGHIDPPCFFYSHKPHPAQSRTS